MIKELDCVALNVDLPEYRLTAGDVGTVVHVYKRGRGFIVEFATFDGRAVALPKHCAKHTASQELRLNPTLATGPRF